MPTAQHRKRITSIHCNDKLLSEIHPKRSSITSSSSTTNKGQQKERTNQGRMNRPSQNRIRNLQKRTWKRTTPGASRANAPIVLLVDASDNAAGAALHQIVDNEMQPLGFYSKKMNDAQKKCSTYDRELLSAYQGIYY